MKIKLQKSNENLTYERTCDMTMIEKCKKDFVKKNILCNLTNSRLFYQFEQRTRKYHSKYN